MSWYVKSPTTQLFVQKFIQANNRETAKLCITGLALCEGILLATKGPTMYMPTYTGHNVAMGSNLQLSVNGSHTWG